MSPLTESQRYKHINTYNAEDINQTTSILRIQAFLSEL